MVKKREKFHRKRRLHNRLHNKVALTVVKDTSLTTSEKEILHLLTDEFLTVKQICYRRHYSHQFVYKILKNLKKKGAFSIANIKVASPRGTMQPKGKIRLHSQEFNIKILWQNPVYQKILKTNNLKFIDGNTIKFYRNSIEIYSGQSFYGNDAQEAMSKSLEYWKHFFARVEHELHVLLMKPTARNIKLVNQHYAHIDSEICENAIERGERIRVFAKEDGKLAFITDDSFGFKEDETVHPETAKQDREIIDKQVNDWRLNHPPTQTELLQGIIEQNKTIQKLAEAIGIVSKTNSKPHRLQDNKEDTPNYVG